MSAGELRFTGERLHAGSPLFAIDLARHRAAYEIARSERQGRRLLDLGCGTGHGVALLAEAGMRIVGVDRVPPDPAHRASGALYCRADLGALPFPAGSFDTVVSFQVIEHLADPTPYLRAIADLLDDGGLAMLTTPNRALSDEVNPYHVREYLSEELRSALAPHFAEVVVLGIGASPRVRAHLDARSARIRRILRLDPLRLRERLPRGVLERLFAWGALLVRRLGSRPDAVPDVDWRDFPVVPADDATSLDWLALCRRPCPRPAPAAQETRPS